MENQRTQKILIREKIIIQVNNSGSGINENGGEKIESVSTGDESAVGFCSLMAVIMVSIVMCMAFTKIRRKKQRN